MVGTSYEGTVGIFVPVMAFVIGTQRVYEGQRTTMSIGILYRGGSLRLRRPRELRYGGSRRLGMLEVGLIDGTKVDEPYSSRDDQHYECDEQGSKTC